MVTPRRTPVLFGDTVGALEPTKEKGDIARGTPGDHLGGRAGAGGAAFALKAIPHTTCLPLPGLEQGLHTQPCTIQESGLDSRTVAAAHDKDGDRHRGTPLHNVRLGKGASGAKVLRRQHQRNRGKRAQHAWACNMTPVQAYNEHARARTLRTLA